jgi:hypothetical protein
MKSHYTCFTCNIEKAATNENFHPSALERGALAPHILAIGKCKICCKEYSDKYNAKRKEKRLTRRLRVPVEFANAKNGVVYIFGSGLPSHPYKIGITTGTDTRKRLSSVQTGNWFTINEIWKSPYILRVDRIEKKLHSHFNHARVSGEWFNLSKKDIKNIPTLIETFLEEV